jgi:hypothetical protein
MPEHKLTNRMQNASISHETIAKLHRNYLLPPYTLHMWHISCVAAARQDLD